MPNYRWSCLACGETNPSQADVCAACQCPAGATLAQISASRAEHVARGGWLLGEAPISATGDLSVPSGRDSLPGMLILARMLPHRHQPWRRLPLPDARRVGMWVGLDDAKGPEGGTWYFQAASRGMRGDSGRDRGIQPEFSRSLADAIGRVRANARPDQETKGRSDPDFRRLPRPVRQAPH